MEEGAKRKGKRHRSSRARNEASEKPYGNLKRRGEEVFRNLSTLERKLKDEIQTSEREKSNRLKAIKRKAESDIEHIRKKERIEMGKASEEFDNKLTELQSNLEEIRQLLKEFSERFADITAQKDALSLLLDRMCTRAEINTGAAKNYPNNYEEAVQAMKNFLSEDTDVSVTSKYVPIWLEEKDQVSRVHNCKWMLENSIDTGQPLGSKLIGSVGEDGLVIQNTSSSVCIVDIKQGSTTITELPDIPLEITHCYHQPNGYIIGITKEGQIFSCNQAWKGIKYKRRHGRLINTKAPLFLGTNDSILTVSADGSQIHTLTASDGIKVRSVKCPFEKVNGLFPVWFGNVLVHTNCPKCEDICIVSVSGSVEQTLHFPGKQICDIAFDNSIDSIYVIYEIQGKREFAVDVIQRGKQTTERAFTLPKDLQVRRPCSITYQSGKLIIFTAGRFLIYQKLFRK